jgi:cobalt-zinc-cadmium efflux system membrane fusion protein
MTRLVGGWWLVVGGRWLVVSGSLALLLVGCGRGAAPAESQEPPTLDVTSWTEASELFMEYPPLVAGQTARFAVHLTRLEDFAAVTKGRARVEFTPEIRTASPTVLSGEALRPGVFRVEGKLPMAGKYRWALIVEGPDVSDRHDLGAATVFADESAAVADAESRQSDDAAAISYLKEQQWTNPFAAVLVQEGDVRRSIRVPAVIEPLTGGEAIVSAPADGRYGAAQLLAVGDRVVAGQALGRFEPRLSENRDDHATLVANVAEAQVTADAARADLERVQKLFAERAVPLRRVTDAQRAVAVADARLTAAQSRLAQRDETLRSGGAASGNTFVLRAPIAGRIAEVHAALGASYDEGAPLFRIVRTDRVELQAHVPASDAPLRQPVHEIALEIPGRPDPIVVEADHMHDAGVIDPKTRALPVQFDVNNRSGQLLIGQTATAILYTGQKERMVVVPKAAVLTEAGRPFVFVQTSGESFARRFIDIAGRDGDLVGVRSGVRLGERVVTRGAYEVQLASAAGGLPAEGHVH